MTHPRRIRRSLPRTRCPWCGRAAPVRRNGALREHTDFQTYEKTGWSKCPGSGQQPGDTR